MSNAPNTSKVLHLLLLLLIFVAQKCTSFTANNINRIGISSSSSSSSSSDTRRYSSAQEDLTSNNNIDINRRSIMKACGGILLGINAIPTPVFAKTDCMSDCLKNCKLIAPKDSAYCLENCKSYCEQDDRTDGLSGSVSSNGGEMGILGTSTVVKGEDKPPSLPIPGLDFSSEKGRKLIGY